ASTACSTIGFKAPAFETGISTVVYPINEITSVPPASGTSNVKLPLASAVVPFSDPFTFTEAPSKGFRFWSTILPLTSTGGGGTGTTATVSCFVSASFTFTTICFSSITYATG